MALAGPEAGEGQTTLDSVARCSGAQLRARYGGPGDGEWNGTPTLVLVRCMGVKETCTLASGTGVDARYRLIEREKEPSP